MSPAERRFRSPHPGGFPDQVGTASPRLASGPLQPVKKVPPAPGWLRDCGKGVWKKAAAILVDAGVLTELDYDALAQYCSAWDDFSDAESHIRENGVIGVGHRGGDIVSPAVRVKSDASARIVKFGALFGMSPTGRTGLGIVAPDEFESDLEQFKRS